jgi:hypothetical protein
MNISTRTHILLLGAVLLLGFAVRIHNLGAAPLRGDEAFAAQYWARLPLAESLARIATIEPHPPLTYAIFHIWGLLAGTDSEFALRFLAAGINWLGIAGVYALGKRLSGRRSIALLCALVWAAHPFLVWHARDFRNYAIWATLSLLTLYTGWRAVLQPSARRLTLYMLAASATALTFYFELLAVAGLLAGGVLALLLRRQPRSAARWALANLAVIGLTGAVFALFQGGLFASGGYAGNTQAFDPGALFSNFLPALTFGELFPPHNLPQIGLLVTLTTILCLVIVWRWQRDTALMLAASLALPFAALALISTRISVFTPRYILCVIPVLLLIHALALGAVQRPALKAALWLLPCIWLVGAAVGLAPMLAPDYRKSPDWKAVRDFFAQNASREDVVIQSAVDAAFGYYVEPVAFTAAVPSSPSQTLTSIEAEMAALAASHPSVWLFEHSYYPWENARLAREWLDANMIIAEETRLLGSPLIRYTRRPQ